MQATVPSSSSHAYGGGHWSDGGTHGGEADDHHNNNHNNNHQHHHNAGSSANSAAAASEVFRDFTWYSAMLLSHLFALEHAHVMREAAAEEKRRRSNASAHSPQLLMRAAMAAAAAAAPATAPTAAAVVRESDGVTSDSAVDGAAPAEQASDASTAASAAPARTHLATQHRPHILLGFTSTVGGAYGSVGESMIHDPATRWTGAAGTKATGAVAAAAAAAVAAEGAGVDHNANTAALLAVFDAFYFPSELFTQRGSEGDTMDGTLDASGRENTGGDDGHAYQHQGGGGGVGGDGEGSATDGTAGGTAAAAAAPRVTPDALREAFHALLLLGQRCAAFALGFDNIISSATTAMESAAEAEMGGQHGAGVPYLSSEDEYRGGGHRAHNSYRDDHLHASVQQAASASLQFLLQLACSCPCASLAYAAQLCLAQALAVQPTPRTATGWAARRQLLRYLPTLQPPSRALLMDGGGVAAATTTTTTTTASGGAGGSSFLPGAGGGAVTAGGTASINTGNTSNGGAGSGGNRVPATQYVRGEDPMLWFDTTGAVHVTTAQRWWELSQAASSSLTTAAAQQAQSRQRGEALVAYCGPLPSTTALPTVQRLLMEEERYMGPHGSAAAVLQSVLEAVSTEVTLNAARVIPGGTSSLVHSSLRRRRGVHSSGSGSGSHSASYGGSAMTATTTMSAASGSPRGGSAGGALGGSSLEMESGGGGAVLGGRVGSPTLPAPSSSAFGSPVTTNSTSASARCPATPGSVASSSTASSPNTPASSSRLSKAAKRRRALLLALAQSHLLPPTHQLATAKTLLYGVFTDSGECPSYYMLLSLYPDVLRAHHAALHYVLFEDGPLSVDERLMVATMAASRHRCEYLVSRFSALLLRYAEEAFLDDEDAEEDYDGDYRDSDDLRGYGRDARSPLYPHHHEHQHRASAQRGLYDGDTDDELGNCEGHRDEGYHPQQRPEAFAYRPCRGQARQRWIVRGPPARLRAVRHFIALAAHTPWMLGDHHIRAILAAGWTIPEVFQLIAIVAQVVPLCGFVMGLFVPAEPWTMTLLPLEVVEQLGHRAVSEDSQGGGGGGGSGGVGGGGGAGGGGPSSGMVNSGSNSALTALRRGPGAAGSNAASASATAAAANAAAGMDGGCPSPAFPHHAGPGRSSFLGTAASGSDMTAMTSAGLPATQSSAHNNNNNNTSGNSGHDNSGVAASHVDVFRRYAGEDSVVSEQRIKGSNLPANPHTLWRSQFTWNEVGATAMEQYYPGAATLMSEEIECFFDVVRQLTKADCVGLMSPDYAPSYAFRSLQLYVQNLLGFMVEDYPYNDINKVLRRPAKWFAQVLTMRPETLTRSEVVRWYVPTTPPTGKPSDVTAESSLVTHQLKREIELLSVVDSAQGGHRGGIESASAHPDTGDAPPPSAAEAARDAAEAEALQTALMLQDERVLLLIALATMEARKEGLLHIMLRPVCSVLSNM